MTAKAFTSDTIAFTEKKMDMSLDDIIKMSKAKTAKSKKQRASNKSHKPFLGTQSKSLKVRQYMDSRSSIRQGVLAGRRTNFQGSRFPLMSEAAKNAAVAPMKNRGPNRNRTTNWNRPSGRATAAMNQQGNGTARGFVIKPPLQQQQQQQRQQQQSQQQTMPKTLDSLFANMKEQRMRTFGHQNNVGNHRTTPIQQRHPWGRGQRFRN